MRLHCPVFQKAIFNYAVINDSEYIDAMACVLMLYQNTKRLEKPASVLKQSLNVRFSPHYNPDTVIMTTSLQKNSNTTRHDNVLSGMVIMMWLRTSPHQVKRGSTDIVSAGFVILHAEL